MLFESVVRSEGMRPLGVVCGYVVGGRLQRQ